jgi:hypothetical protein
MRSLPLAPFFMAKLKRPIYDRLKETGEFFPVVLWPLLKERKTFWLLPIALCLILLGLLYLALEA